MKNLNLILILSLLVALVFTTTNCSKKTGCTDSKSKNYDAEAKVDDGSCKYEGKAIFWYGQKVSAELIELADGVALPLKYYVDDKLIGSSSISVFWANAPSCGADASISVTKNLGTNKTQAYNYKVTILEDGDEETLWQGTVNFNANECNSIELKIGNIVE